VPNDGWRSGPAGKEDHIHDPPPARRPGRTAAQRFEVAVFDIPTPEAESDGTLTCTSTTVVVAEPSVGDVTGLGFTSDSAACADVIERTLRPVVVGSDRDDVPGTWRRMVAAGRRAGVRDGYRVR